MNIKIYFIFLVFRTVITNAINGKNQITSHAYDNATILDTNPVFCGVPGSVMDLTRITAVQNLSLGECGTCLKVTCLSSGGYVYVMAVDKGGIGLDLNQVSFKSLFGEDTGRFDASWSPVPTKHCKGVLKDNYKVINSNVVGSNDDYTDDNDGMLVQKPNITNTNNNNNSSSSSSSAALLIYPFYPLVALFNTILYFS